jgi:hypothetical protein
MERQLGRSSEMGENAKASGGRTVARLAWWSHAMATGLGPIV